MKWKIKKRYITLFFILLLVILAYLGFFKKDKEPSFDISEVQRQNISEIVSVTGKVKPSQEAKLNFEKIGIVSKIFLSVGSQVKKNQMLAQISNNDLLAELKRTQAVLEQARAQKKNSESLYNYQLVKLQELKRGKRQEEINIKKSEIDITEQNLSNTYNDVPRTLQYVFTLSDDAIRNKTSGIFNGSLYSPYVFILETCSQTEKSNAEHYRLLSENILIEFEPKIFESSSLPQGEQEQMLEKFKNDILVFQKTLNVLNNALTLDCVINDGSFDEYRANILSGKTSLNTAFSSINAKIENIASFKRQIEKTKRELELMLAGATPEEISAQEFQVEQARASVLSQDASLAQAGASVLSASAQLAKTYIRSPFDGIISRIDIKIGEAIQPGTPAIALISENQYEIEAFVPEADIAKIALEKPAQVTLDAYGDSEKFQAAVSFIDPAETILEAVPTYKIILNFSKQDTRVKAGMTANIDITTQIREGVLAIPQRAISIKNGIKTVKAVLGENQTAEKNVEVGITGSDGLVEIISGLSLGDKVVVYEK